MAELIINQDLVQANGVVLLQLTGIIDVHNVRYFGGSSSRSVFKGTYRLILDVAHILAGVGVIVAPIAAAEGYDRADVPGSKRARGFRHSWGQ